MRFRHILGFEVVHIRFRNPFAGWFGWRRFGGPLGVIQRFDMPVIRISYFKRLSKGGTVGVRRLKKKDELNYRRGNTAHHCANCDRFVADIKTSLTRTEPRCGVIGINHGRMYRVNPNNICDAYDNTENLKRLRGY